MTAWEWSFGSVLAPFRIKNLEVSTMVKIDVPAQALDAVVQAMQTHGAELDRLAALEAETLTALERDNRGPWAMEGAKAKIEAQREAARQSAKEFITEQKAAFFGDVDRQSFPDGTQINSSDYELLRGGLVESPEELAFLRDRYAQNPAMRRAIAKYATTKKWNGFSDVTNADLAREFGARFFEMAEHGAANPHSYDGMLISSKDAVSQMLNAHGLFAGV
jgi:hypothetical protein